MQRIDSKLLYGGASFSAAYALVVAVTAFLVAGLLVVRSSGSGKTPGGAMEARLPPSVQTRGIWSPQPHLAVYDARQNLRLAQHFGPVLLLKQGPYPLLTALRNLAPTLRGRNGDNAQMPSKLSDTVLLVNSAAEAKVLLERHGATYSSRGPSIAAGKYLSSNRRIVLLPYGAQWRSHHKALVQLLLRDKIQHKWRKALQHEALALITNITALCHTPSGSPQSLVTATRILDEVSRFTASSVLQIAYARRAKSSQDPVLEDLERVSRNIADAFAPSRYSWIERYPVLDRLPVWMSPWKSRLLLNHQFEAGVYTHLVDDVERRLDTGNEADDVGSAADDGAAVISVTECCAAELLAQVSSAKDGLDRKDIAYICATVFEAGAETTAMTINTFLLAAALHPDIVRRAQTELQEAIAHRAGDDTADGGSSHSPGFESMGQTPYVCAIVKECLRLTPTGSSGVAHTSSRTTGFDTITLAPQHQKQESQPCLIPAGATILPNIYGIHHDKSTYPDPWTFNPDRFLSHPCSALTHDHHAFGFGRRICPGLDLAANSLYISIAHLLAFFQFHLNTQYAHRLADRVRNTYADQRRQFYRLFPSLSTIPPSDMDTLTVTQLLLDAYTTHAITRAELASCITLSPRNDINTAQQTNPVKSRA